MAGKKAIFRLLIVALLVSGGTLSGGPAAVGSREKRPPAAEINKGTASSRQTPSDAGKVEAVKALEEMEKAISLNPSELSDQLKYVDEASKQGQFDRAIEFLKQLVAANKNNANLCYSLARIMVHRVSASDNVAEQASLTFQAIDSLNQAIELDHGHWHARLLRGMLYSRFPKPFDKSQEAMSDFETLIQQQSKLRKRPDFVYPFIHLSKLYIRTNQDEKARALVAEGLRQFPGNRELLKISEDLNKSSKP